MSELPPELARTLLAVADEGSLDAAARALHVTPSAVSQRIKLLEQRVGRVLLVRSRPARLTASGAVVARFARQVALLEAAARAGLGTAGADDRVTLSIAVNADSVATWFVRALAEVPPELGVCFDLVREDQDRTAELLRQGLVVAAVTSSPRPVQGCSSRRLGSMRYHAVAEAAFARRHGLPAAGRSGRSGRDRGLDPAAGAALAAAPVVVFDRSDDLQDRFLREAGAPESTGPRHVVPTPDGFVEAVVAGLGWGVLTRRRLADHRDRADLVELAPGRSVDVALHWHQWRLDSPHLAAVADAVTAAAARALA